MATSNSYAFDPTAASIATALSPFFYLADWGGQGSLNTPIPVLKSAPYGAASNASQTRPIRHSSCLTVMSEHVGASAIIRLFHLGRPATIAGFIIAIVVNAVQAVLWRRLRPHIFNKSREVFPSVAHRDPSPRIIGMTPASIVHLVPDAVERMTVHSVGRSMLKKQFTRKAPARFTFANSEFGGGYRPFCAAVASAKPVERASTVTAGVFRQDKPASKPLPNSVYLPSHLYVTPSESNRWRSV
jgi:hypothetical protein